VTVILRRPYVARPDDGRFNIYDAMNGKRDVAIYGNHETYAMLDVPAGQTAFARDVDEEEAFDKSPYLGPKAEQPRTSELEDIPPQYSNTYGQNRI